ALEVARWLSARPEVRRVLHPALETCPGHAFWKRDYSGASGLFGIELQPFGANAICAMVDGLEVFGIGAGWGGCESLALPVHASHHRRGPQRSGPMIRLHVGLEHPR